MQFAAVSKEVASVFIFLPSVYPCLPLCHISIKQQSSHPNGFSDNSGEREEQGRNHLRNLSFYAAACGPFMAAQNNKIYVKREDECRSVHIILYMPHQREREREIHVVLRRKLISRCNLCFSLLISSARPCSCSPAAQILFVFFHFSD